VLLAKLQEKRGGNPQVQLILEEPHGDDPRVTIIIRGGSTTREDKVTLETTTKESRFKRAIEKTPEFDLRKEKKIFEEARREFGGDQVFSSKVEP
jgi:hypothetical protein